MDRRALLIAAACLLAIPLAGTGPINGDQAVYLHQAHTGDWFARWIHVPYVLWLVPHTAWSADVANVLLGAVAVGLLGVRFGWQGGVVALGALLPWLPFAEVDVPWFVLMVVALAWAPAAGLAVAVSPTALAGALRWRNPWAPLVALGLALASAGAWLVGNRGVLVVHWSSDPVAQVLPLLLPAVAVRWDRDKVLQLATLAPILLAPGDVPAFWLAVPFFAEHARGRPLAVHLGIGAVWLGLRWHQAVEHAGLLERAATELHADDRFEGSWSDRVRLSLAVAGHPDALVGPGPCVRLGSHGVRSCQTPADR